MPLGPWASRTMYAKPNEYLYREERLTFHGQSHIEHTIFFWKCAQCECRLGKNTLLLLVATLASTKWYKNPEKWLKTWQMGTHLRVLIESYPMKPTWQGLDGFQKKIFASLFLYKCSLSIEKVKIGLCLQGFHAAFLWKSTLSRLHRHRVSKDALSTLDCVSGHRSQRPDLSCTAGMYYDSYDAAESAMFASENTWPDDS